MSEPVQTGRRALLKGATGLAGATMGHPVWAQTQVSSAGGTRGPEDQPAVAATWVSTTETAPWQVKPLEGHRGFGWDTLDLRVRLDASAQVADGSGA
jgi:hypothetical protein